MVFSSTVFLFIFLPVTLAGYYLIRRELRNVFLLVMSLLFYAAGEPWFVYIMMASIAINYALGMGMWAVRERSSWLKRVLLLLALATNLGLLFYYKYYDFVVSNLNSAFGMSIPLRHIALPIGISFFTFQGMSYVLDVYMGKTEVQKNPLNVALYIALFPQLIAGPIVRYSDVNREIEERQETVEDFASGVKRFTLGLAKKVILSNNFALLADKAFGTAADQLGAGLAWLGALGYALQIYFDFSGYSDMAIGLGRMFGFHFLENFDHPYIADSVQNFWRRWHISLSTWFRDYVYIPMGGNRRGNVYVHLLVVFLLTGIWHGASWNFIVWGLWHGAFQLLERVLRQKNIRIPVPRPIKWLYTMLVVLIGWVFFRAANLTAALDYLKCMLGAAGNPVPMQGLFYAREFSVTLIIGMICSLPLVPYINAQCEKHAALGRLKPYISPVIVLVLLLCSIGVLSVTTYNPFIYFNF